MAEKTEKKQNVVAKRNAKMDTIRNEVLVKYSTLRLAIKLTNNHVNPWNKYRTHQWIGKLEWLVLKFSSKIQIPKPM